MNRGLGWTDAKAQPRLGGQMVWGASWVMYTHGERSGSGNVSVGGPEKTNGGLPVLVGVWVQGPWGAGEAIDRGYYTSSSLGWLPGVGRRGKRSGR